MSKVYDVIIIGSGPAGYTAAIYTSRAELSTLMIAGDVSGGQLMLTSEVENFPGFENGILGPDLMANMKAQAKRFGTEFLTEFVTEVSFDERPFKLKVANGDTYEARAIIISTGSSARWLGLESEKRLMGKGVTSCATCDGYFFRDKHVCVVGGGDSAMEEALTLTKFANHVTIIHRRDSFRASKIMQDRVLNHPKIDVIWDTEVEEILGDDFVSGLKLKNLKTNKSSEIKTDGIFVAIGHNPATKIFADLIDLDEAGYVKPTSGVRTNVEGVFVAGDVADPRYRQAITAAGDGCKAALEVEKFLAEQAHEVA